jgi:hypothetical protein
VGPRKCIDASISGPSPPSSFDSTARDGARNCFERKRVGAGAVFVTGFWDAKARLRVT